VVGLVTTWQDAEVEQLKKLAAEGASRVRAAARPQARHLTHPHQEMQRQPQRQPKPSLDDAKLDDASWMTMNRLCRVPD
jgi:hypothetical protein